MSDKVFSHSRPVNRCEESSDPDAWGVRVALKNHVIDREKWDGVVNRMRDANELEHLDKLITETQLATSMEYTR